MAFPAVPKRTLGKQNPTCSSDKPKVAAGLVAPRVLFTGRTAGASQLSASSPRGLEVSALGLGCMGLSAFYGAPTEEGAALAVIHRALELGVTLLDTSDVYGPFTNEELVGRAIKGRRDQYTIATKCGIVFGKDGSRYFDGSRAYVRAACEASLKRLGIDTIDLYYLHRVDPNTPVAETFAEMKALQAEGKVRHVGISEASPDDIRAAHAVTPLSAVQLEWSLWSRDVEDDIIPVCRELGIGIVAYSPLGRGFLTGAPNMALVEKIKGVAAAKGCTPAQLALAWVISRGSDVVPIPGTTKVARLEENVGALAVELTSADLAALDGLGAEVQGDRYPDMKSMTYHYGRK
ncbi:hypothetical protein MNEG_3065 [Monoraphidium neglectum]|uniref:NADP-dependent oxidoreductase domain-containing protein n=1 Tax=Monoraphidium neglectum TaxID=145388 RepID=A0A0D2MWQ9_9CHLO|nr:hypothetical protein MNEG_3065 [Monoraphidium neglectum]KIZ04897.1 hypothetical protein MNEG_3065 [Monoraphidium neglectum]|eukprot:XP_013903916.1 hypothetical protein MNEG_3065 [Monoraphidium neglectum]